MYARRRRTSLIQAALTLQSNVCWRQPPPVRSATKVQVVSQIHWAYSSPPSTLQSIVYTRFALPIVISAGKKSEQINKLIYRRADKSDIGRYIPLAGISVDPYLKVSFK